MSNSYLGDDDLIFNTSSRIPVCLCCDTILWTLIEERHQRKKISV